jgi:hypothetical protein
MHAANPEKLDRIHKGTPFFFLAWSAFDMGAYERALFYLDAALSEDIDNSSDWRNLPACKLMRLQQNAKTAADRIIPELRNRIENQLRRFEGEQPMLDVPRTVDDFVFRFVEPRLPYAEQRHLIAALYAWFFEFEDLCKQIVLRSERTSVLPVLLHLFKGGLVFESLLKLYYAAFGCVQLGQIFQCAAFRNDFPGINVRTSAHTWQGVAEGMPDRSPEGAFSVTARLRNYLGHDLGRPDDFQSPEQYREYFDHEVSAILHVIVRKSPRVAS